MRFHQAFLVVSLVTLLSACAAWSDKWHNAGPAAEFTPSPPAQAADPMVSFARMVGGEWKMTAESGTSLYDSWYWGPGQHSLRAMTHGEAADHSPWREMWVMYWHPGRQQVCRLGVSCWERGVWDGTIKLEGEAAQGVADLFQSRTRRKLGVRWEFDGPDKYRETLLEDSGTGFRPLVSWDHVRSKPGAALTSASPLPEDTLRPSERLKAFEPLLGHTWETRIRGAGNANGERSARGIQHIRSTFEYVPLADAIYVRVLATSGKGEPVHLLDAYLYDHTGSGVLRCLALSSDGGVYEGDVTAIEGGPLEFDLKGYEGERVGSLLVRFDFERNGSVRQRVWTLDGAERALIYDLNHEKIESGQ